MFDFEPTIIEEHRTILMIMHINLLYLLLWNSACVVQCFNVYYIILKHINYDSACNQDKSCYIQRFIIFKFCFNPIILFYYYTKLIRTKLLRVMAEGRVEVQYFLWNDKFCLSLLLC